MTPDELTQYDGREGRRAYVAVSGKVYDLSDSPLWIEGDHRGAHRAGKDLTAELQTAPHVRAIVERFPVVGLLEQPAPSNLPGLGKLLAAGALLAAFILAALWLYH